MEQRFVSVHGIDGTGKTTVSHRLVDALCERGQQAVHFDTIYQPESLPTPPAGLSKRALSLYKKLHQSQVIHDVLASGLSVVKDRWYVDLLADASFAGESLPDTPAVCQPDVAVLLTCAEPERQSRLSRREDPTADDLIPKTDGSRADYFERYLIDNLPTHARRVITIDNSDLTVSEVVAQLATELE